MMRAMFWPTRPVPSNLLKTEYKVSLCKAGFLDKPHLLPKSTSIPSIDAQAGLPRYQHS